MLLVASVLAGPVARAADQYLQVFVTAPYLEMHTGPGRGYPVFNVVDRDASVDVLKRYTDWFKVRTGRGVEGWVSAHDMEQTVLASTDSASSTQNSSPQSWALVERRSRVERIVEILCPYIQPL